jgi:hypothetical protein
MSNTISTQDLNNTYKLLDELFQEVSDQEGMLTAGTKLGMGGSTLQCLRDTKISFGNPKDNLIHLTEELFHDVGLELSPIHKQQMGDRYNFYYMTLAVSMQPGRGTQFTRVECKLDFAPKGEHEPIVQTLFPNSEWKEMLKLGTELKLGLNGNLDWQAGVSDPAIMKNLPGSIKANVSSSNEFKACITIPSYSFELGKPEIEAVGAGNSECFWRIEKPDLQKAQTVQFGMVFKVPKATKMLELTALVVVEPDFRWLTTNLADVFDELSSKLKNLLSRKDHERQGKERLPLGDHEKWRLVLPG